MAYPVMPLGFLGSQGDQDTYRIERSLRFNSADSAYLSRTPASAGNRKTWTWSGWAKICGFVSDPTIFDGGSTGPICSIFYDSTTNKIRWFFSNSAVSASESAYTSALIRDPSAWYHFVFALDTTQATLSERAKIYINGVQQTLTGLTGTYLTQNSDQGINRNVAHYIGAYSYTGIQRYFDGYLTEINFIDGQALTPSSFGETDAITGRWKAKAYSGTYGTNGFYLKFADNSGTTATTLGKDSSGNGNNWTPNNFSVTAGAGNDSLVDSPTNYGTDTGVGGEVRGNYATLNAIDNGGVSLLNGNLDANLNATRGVRGTIGISSGKYYFEMTVQGFGVSGPAVGVAYPNANISSSYAGSDANAWIYNGGDGKIYNNGAGTGSNASYTTNDIIGVAVNMDSGTVTFYKNNSLQPTTVSGLSGTVFPVVTSGGTAGIQNLNFGQRPFAYTAPTGFKALCTTNLPTPTIQKPSKYMDVVTYTGTGSALTPTSSLEFSPDLVWIKGRSGATDHALYDTVRGAEKRLESNNTDAEVTSDGGVTAFNSNGFTLGTLAQVNTNTATYVAWAWDEAPIAGMDIVGYTGNGTTQNISHSLGVAPKMIIVKSRSASSDWVVGHASLDATSPWGYYIFLSSTAARNSAGAINSWGNNSVVVPPTSSGFTIGNGGNLNASSATYIAYLFAEVEGFSKFGSYTGNASTDGPFVYCGFRPRWVMVKRTDTLETWNLHDTARSISNVVKEELRANASNAEAATNDFMDILSNGFKLKANLTSSNASGGTYIFAAFAESPFKYARAR